MWDCKLENNTKTQILDVDFGLVENGKTGFKIVKLFNKTDVEKSYEVQRDPSTNPIDNVFVMKEYSWLLDSGCEYSCHMTYQPRVPFCKNTDYFTIVDNDGIECLKIVAKGISTGPKIEFSKTKLIFYLDEGEKEESMKREIKIRNISKVPAIFQFDVDEEHCSFKVTPLTGAIEPSSFINITIFFVPSATGIFTYYLPCLFLNHRPMMIELYGCLGSEYASKNEFQRDVLAFALPEQEGYENYMNNVSNVRRREPPLISLSNNYIDFGQASIGFKNYNRRPPQTVCFYNHSSINFHLTWGKVKSNIFKINPPDIEVNEQNSFLFEISFNPREENSFYYGEILLNIFRIEEKQLTIPMVLPLRIMGHSFRKGTKRPISHYKIPQIVTMPACCPNYPVYTTFLITKLESQSPLMFHFLPPNPTHFTVKPMLGIIYKDYQIVTVELFPEDDEHLYYERWAIQFNDCEKSKDFIDFKGYAEYLNLQFETDNCFSFDPVFPGCRQFRQVSVRNITRHCIKYSFEDLPEEIKIQSKEDIINPNETIWQKWMFHPLEIGNYNFNVSCKLIAVDGETMEVKDSPNKMHHVKVTGVSEEGKLMATPDELIFDELAVQNSKTLNFELINLSRVVVHFILSTKQKNFPIGCLEKDVKISPQIETILPQEKMIINVILTPHENGFYEFYVQYSVRVDANSEKLVLNNEPENICHVNCASVHPTLIVKDLLYFASQPGISKVSLWKSMKINKIHEEPLRIVLLLTNPTKFPVSWSLKRIQICSCEKKLKSRSLSFQSVVYDCVHREIFKIYPKSGTIQTRGEERLSMEIRYNLLGITELEWELILTDNRRITLKVNLRCVSEECDELFFQDTLLSFDKVHIGDLNPIHQMCWLYNSTKREISYSLDVNTLKEINRKFCADIFTCVNPSGSLKGMSHQPIIFKYHPRQFQEYLIKIPLKLGKKETELIIKGESSRDPITKVVERISPYQDKFSIPEVPVYFNTDSLTLSPLTTQSTITRMIMIHNRHPQDILAYTWESSEVPEIIKISIHPSRGRIQSLKMQTFLLTVITGPRPSKITICLNCKFINISEKRLYEKEILSSLHTLKSLENNFTITEKGIYYPKDVQEKRENLKPSAPFYKGLTIRAFIYSKEDFEMKATLEQQLKLMPTNEIKLHSVKKGAIVTENSLRVSGFILECIIWDILNSREFQYLMKEVKNDSTGVKYSQIVIDSRKRKALVRKSFIKPPKSMIENILQTMIFTIIHEEYGLDRNHLVEPIDIRQPRQLTYRKKSSGTQMNRFSQL
ncbi:cilia- and flagella-associated protein 65 [Leptopilina heterotoma]|uniref:cilia- and flagella-associated protein 65 n=1 Tax=Leptopilina heterotoma TaxID=63436 RepID=UPI001CA80045|nr:cilia- and flagella-associated protein 65 [Leptopilina heterotoma]